MKIVTPVFILILFVFVSSTVGYSEQLEYSNFSNVDRITCFIYGIKVNQYTEIRPSMYGSHKSSVFNIFEN